MMLMKTIVVHFSIEFERANNKKNVIRSHESINNINDSIIFFIFIVVTGKKLKGYSYLYDTQ